MPLRRDKIITLAVIFVIVTAAALYTWTVKRDAYLSSSAVSQALAVEEGEAEYTDLSGTPVSLVDEIAGVVIVNSWASWSPDSAQELPQLAKLSEVYGDRVSVVAINRAEPSATAERFLLTVGASDGVKLVLDPDDNYYSSVGGYAMPETIIYDTRGEIVHHHRGAMSYEDMTLYIERALNSEEE